MPERGSENPSQHLIEIARTAIVNFADTDVSGLMVVGEAARGTAKPESPLVISPLKQTGSSFFYNAQDLALREAIQSLGPKVVLAPPFVLDDPEGFHFDIVEHFLTPEELQRLDIQTYGGRRNKSQFDAWVIVARTPEEESQLTILFKTKIAEVKSELPRRRLERLRSLVGI